MSLGCPGCGSLVMGKHVPGCRMIGVEASYPICGATMVKEHYQGCPHRPEPSEALAARFPSDRREAVNHPDHYGGKDDSYEVIKVMEAWLTAEEYRGALKFNVHKYLARARKKGGLEDLQKAAKYIEFLLDFEQRQVKGGRNATS